MGLKYYLNLFKGEKACEDVKLRYFFGIFSYIVCLACLTVYFAIRKTNIVVAAVAAGLSLVALVASKILSQMFGRFIDAKIVMDELDERNEIDAAFASYRKGYYEFKEYTRKLGRKLMPFDIVYGLLFFSILVPPVVFALVGMDNLGKVILGISIILLWVVIALNIVLGLILNRKNGIWYQNYASELNIINNYKSRLSGRVVKFKITEDKNQQKQAEYIFPDLDLRQRFKKVGRMFAFTMLALVVLYIALIFSIPNLADEDLAGKLIGIAFGVFAVLIIASGIIVSVLQRTITKQQLDRLNKNPDKNALHIKLHQLKTPFTRRWNILFITLFAAAIVSNILFSSVVSLIAKSSGFGWIFALLFLAEVIAMFVAYFKSYGNLRLRMIDIENMIDRSTFEANQ